MAQAIRNETIQATSLHRHVTQSSEQVLLTVIGEILLWIESNLDENLMLTNVTAKSGYAHWYFQRKFRQITGISLADYIRLRRILNAADQLVMTDKKILIIALENGFGSQQAFTRIFKRYLRKTPGEIRREHQGDSMCRQQLSQIFYADHTFLRRFTAVYPALHSSLPSACTTL